MAVISSVDTPMRRTPSRLDCAFTGTATSYTPLEGVGRRTRLWILKAAASNSVRVSVWLRSVTSVLATPRPSLPTRMA